jgi:hypothetical protein
MSTHLSRRLFTATALAGAAIRPAWADALPRPQEKPILSISGNITRRNTETAAVFDRPMLEALGMQGFVTGTPWYSGKTRFDGVSMNVLLKSVGATGTSILATALNDYSTEIPSADFAEYEVILALKRDGAYMPVRDKGPLFIVYPYDSSPDLQSPKFYSRSAWQLAQITVR